jgi:peptide/nickel transport system permease protein
MVLLIILMAVFAPLIQRYELNDQDYTRRFQGPGLEHFMGTDNFGRDLWARIVGGSRISVQVGFIAVFTGSTLGLVLGVISGYIGGSTDNFLQRLTEIMLAFPGLLLALALMATLGSGVDKVIIAISIGYIPRTLRVMRGTVLSTKENVYVDAARAIGATPVRVMARHILPNVMAPYLIIATSLLSTAILAEATLSFLGLGVPPPHPSWGRMLSGAVAEYAVTAPWLVIFPGLAITWLVLGFNLFGDALRDVWDPRLRGSQ